MLYKELDDKQQAWLSTFQNQSDSGFIQEYYFSEFLLKYIFPKIIHLEKTVKELEHKLKERQKS